MSWRCLYSWRHYILPAGEKILVYFINNCVVAKVCIKVPRGEVAIFFFHSSLKIAARCFSFLSFYFLAVIEYVAANF